MAVSILQATVASQGETVLFFGLHVRVDALDFFLGRTNSSSHQSNMTLCCLKSFKKHHPHWRPEIAKKWLDLLERGEEEAFIKNFSLLDDLLIAYLHWWCAHFVYRSTLFKAWQEAVKKMPKIETGVWRDLLLLVFGQCRRFGVVLAAMDPVMPDRKIMCKLNQKYMFRHHFPSSQFDTSVALMNKSEIFGRVQKSLSYISTSQIFILKVEQLELPVHQWILQTQWPWFKNMLNANMVEVQTRVIDLTNYMNVGQLRFLWNRLYHSSSAILYGADRADLSTETVSYFGLDNALFI